MTARRRTLIILSPAFPGDEQDVNWVPSQALLVRSLIERDPDLSVVVLSFLYPSTTVSYQWHGAEVIPFDGMKARKWRRLLLWRRVIKTLKAICGRDEVVGLLSFWCHETALVGSWFGRRHGLTHRCWILGQDARAFNRWVKFVRPQAEELVAMSPFLQKTFLRNHGIRPARVVPNGIRQDLFQLQPGVERDIDLLGVGSLQQLKQYHLFVEVVSQLRTWRPGINAVLCGGGEEKDRLEKMIEVEGLGACCRLLGEVPHPEALQLMQRTKILLHPSSYEGYSTVALEALYAGAHVVSFCDPMDGENDRWHVVHNTVEMLEKVMELLGSPFTEYEPLLVHSMADVADEIKSLFIHH